MSSTQGGSYSEISRLVWPTGETGPRQLLLGASASLASAVTSTALYARVRIGVGGGSPSFSFASWLTKAGGVVGLGARAGDGVVAI